MTIDLRYISKALNKVYPDTEWAIENNDLENIILISGPEITSTKDEIIQMAQDVLNEEIATEQALVASRESAIQKLSTLGLTEEEARAVIGL